MVKYVQVTFKVFCDTTFGQSLYLIGSVPQLKQWTVCDAIKLSSDNYTDNHHLWESPPLPLPLNTVIEFKFFKKTDKGDVWWEQLPKGDNRKLSLSMEEDIEVLTEFGVVQTQVQLQSSDDCGPFEENKVQPSPAHRKFTLVLSLPA